MRPNVRFVANYVVMAIRFDGEKNWNKEHKGIDNGTDFLWKFSSVRILTILKLDNI